MAGFGETLYQARAHMGVTLKEAEQATRISRHHLAALEEENFSALPPLIYQRGIIRNYANYLRLDPGKLLVMYEESQGAPAGTSPSGLEPRPPVNMPGHWTPNFAVISFAVVLSAIVLAWIYSAFVAQPDTITTPTEPVPTATPFESDIPVPTKAPTMPPPSPTAEPTQQPQSSTNEGERNSIEQRGGDNVREADAPEATQDPAQSQRNSSVETPPATQEPTATEAAEPTVAVDESELTSINITATSDIWVTVWADEQVVFDGNLSGGQATGHLVGNSFRVYTSIGAETVFTNACGDEYLMGYETGQANYTLTKTADSCPPVRE
jgi:cytoskeletal protein RodZ